MLTVDIKIDDTGQLASVGKGESREVRAGGASAVPGPLDEIICPRPRAYPKPVALHNCRVYVDGRTAQVCANLGREGNRPKRR